MLATLLIVVMLVLQTGVVLLDFNVGFGFIPAAVSANRDSTDLKIANRERP